MNRIIAVLTLMAVMAVAIAFTIHDIARNCPLYTQIVNEHIMVIPVKAGDLANLLQKTGWKLVTEDNVLSLSSRNREDLDIIVCSDQADLSRSNPKFWNARGMVSPPDSNMVVYVMFCTNPKQDSGCK